MMEILYPDNSECDRNDEMKNGSPSDGNVCFPYIDHMGCPTESDDDIPDYTLEMAESETEPENFDVESFGQLFRNVSRVYMFSKGIFWGTDSQTCKPQMKLDITICLLGSVHQFRKDEQWIMREIKQLFVALSTSDEDHDIQYSRIRDCFNKLAARNRVLKKLFVNGLLRMITESAPFYITNEVRQKSKKQAGNSEGKKK
ncbi:hypothetical protein MKX01_032709 [Papaver californicum]|nr:hypothetical protein MKX01_032709 [Papaver californicum]